jgi:general secretion pathway protein G
MKTTPRKGSAGFTLIELMAVITIIVILAGLVVGGLGYVSEKQATSKAKVQISLISKALEEYKLDMGTYPPTGNLTVSGAVGSTNGNTNLLFKALYYDSNNDNKFVPTDTDQKIYLPDLDPVTNKQGWSSATTLSAGLKILDPWGNEYLYRTAKGTPPATGATPTNSNCQNPDFDLWSAGKNGKTNQTPTHADCRDDIKNF